MFPAQEVHAAAPFGLADALGLGHGAQALGLGGDRAGRLIGVVARVQPDLVAALVDAAHQRADGGVLGLVVGVELGRGAPADEVERTGQPMALGHVHDPVEGVGRIGGMQAGPEEVVRYVFQDFLF